MKISAWNIRGLNDPLKQAEVNTFMRTNRLDVLGILETRVKEHHAKRIVNNHFNQYNIVTNYTAHYNGRIWCLWNPSTTHLDQFTVHEQFIHCKLHHYASGKNCWLTMVYGFNDGVQRRALWNHLVAASNLNEEWLLLGDFNVVRDLNERISNIPPDMNDILEFNQCLLQARLDDLNGTGSEFTWTNKQETGTRVWSKLDRALVNQVWLSNYPNSTVFFPPAGISDHSPVLVTAFSEVVVKKRFSFLNCWTKSPPDDSVNNKWKGTHYGTPMHILFSKMKSLKSDLLSLHKPSFANLSAQVQEARTALHNCQSALQSDPLSASLIQKEHDLLDVFSF
ncbi:uncharacterized protein LOC141595553 [Silene latifolia]|uniref:uncharacterized protein LOC141595553 n=1 Tax=Silene latifolia TaxID=37657 RepID=UPI003D77156B